MAIRSVVTEGYGPGATIPLVVTMGYAIGVEVVPDGPISGKCSGSALFAGVSGGSARFKGTVK